MSSLGLNDNIKYHKQRKYLKAFASHLNIMPIYNMESGDGKLFTENFYNFFKLLPTQRNGKSIASQLFFVLREFYKLPSSKESSIFEIQ